jgi:FAD/FMN-containing dehydrogenase
MNAQEVCELVGWAADRDLVLVAQASGHGAGASVGQDRLLIDTSALVGVQIDPEARTANVGAGVTWSAVNTAAQQHGLLGLAGSSPTVAVAGYTFGGGVGWLTRPYGMASSALLAVDYVDGQGRIRRAAADAPDAVDRDAVWAFRGGGGVGIATALHFDVVAPNALWAGYQLWGINALAPVVAAWAAAMDDIGDDLTTSISVLHTPPGPAFPPALQGVPIVHMAFASSAGQHAAMPLLEALRDAPAPTVDNHWAPADAARLAQIHLDPPGPVPALGTGRWLGPNAPGLAGDVFATVAAPDSPVTMVEFRNLANSAPARPGAMTTVPGPFLLHAVGVAGDPDSRRATERGLSQVQAVARSADVGLAAASFAEGRGAVPDGLDAAALQRLAEVRRVVDPDGRVSASRISGPDAGV